MISNRARRIKSSPTLALAAKAKELTAQGHDVISLSVGEPDWDTFEVAKDAAIQGILTGQTKYVASNGIPELRKAVAKQLLEETGVTYTADQVTVTIGGKFTLFSALNTLLDVGDEVIVPAPFWVSYPTMVEMVDAVPRLILTHEKSGFKITAEELRERIGPKTRALILNSPSNPTGEVYSVMELKALADVLRDFPTVAIISDDIYNRLMFSETGLAPHILRQDPSLASRTIVVNGASKSYSMTGWRIGWAAGPLDVIKAMTNYQSQTVSCTPHFGQTGAVAALESGGGELKDSLAMLKRRMEFGYKELNKIPSISCRKPEGAFYFWTNVSETFGKSVNTSVGSQKIQGSGDFSRLLLDEKKVALVPGVEFGVEGYVRMSFAIEEKRMTQAFQRISEFVSSLK